MDNKRFSRELDSFGLPVLEDMSNAIQKYTGLPGVVYFGTKDQLKNPQAHALGRVKWIHAGKEAFVSIRADRDGKRKVGGDSKMIARLEKLVRQNEELLWGYWNTPQPEADAAALLQGLKKV